MAVVADLAIVMVHLHQVVMVHLHRVVMVHLHQVVMVHLQEAAAVMAGVDGVAVSTNDR